MDELLVYGKRLLRINPMMDELLKEVAISPATVSLELFTRLLIRAFSGGEKPF